MATLAAPSPRASWLRAKYGIFGLIGLMLLYVLRHNESFLVHPDDPVWQHYRLVWWYLLPHGIAGACALLLGPMQFSDRLRQRYAKLHRIIGRIYVGGVLFAAPLGFFMQFYEERMGETRSFSIAAGVDAALWMTTTAIAFSFIRRGNVQQHRRWMTRSFAVAIVFLEVRMIAGVTGWERLGSHAVETIVWSCLAFSLLFADLALDWQQFRQRRLPAKAHAAAG